MPAKLIPIEYYDLRQLLMVKVANAIKERNWTQAKAADALGVSQPRISDLQRGKAQGFSTDTLLQWLLMLGRNVEIVVDGTATNRDRTKEAHEEIEFLTNAINMAPASAGLLMDRGDVYSKLRQYDLAIGDYTRAIELAPDRPGPRNQRALAYIKSGQLNAALIESNKLIELFPDYSGGYSQRAAANALLNNHKDAIADYALVISMEPHRPGPYWNRGLSYEQIGKPKKALADFAKVVERQRATSVDRANTWQNRADTAVQQNRSEHLRTQSLERKRQYEEAARNLSDLIATFSEAQEILAKALRESEHARQ